MDDAHGYEEQLHTADAARITVNGDYLCVEGSGQPRHIYRRVPPGSPLHPMVSRTVHDGELYGLVWVEDDE
jgi:hypothetical protein